MCFPTLFPDERTGETPTIYYVLSHPISRFSLKTRMGSIPSYWGNPYHLLCASPSYSSIFFENTHGLNLLLLGKPALTGETPIIYYVLPHRIGLPGGRIVIGETSIIYYVLPHWIGLLGKPLLFTMCFPILFSGGRLGDTPIIYYVLPRRAHCHWGTLYYFVCASPSCSSASALPLGKPLLFSGCFPSYRCSRLGTDPDRGRCQSHSSGHWGNLYYLVGAFPSYSPASALGKLLSFSRCFPIIFPGERIGER